MAPHRTCFPILNDTEMPCDLFYNYDECDCPPGLIGYVYPAGTGCIESEPCSGFEMPDRSCVDKCPEGYDSIGVTPVGGSCVIEGYFSKERLKEERRCDDDGECVWSKYDYRSCCACELQIYSQETVTSREIWRETNCDGSINYSQWKWKDCPESPHRHCNQDIEQTPLECKAGRCIPREP